MDPLPLEAFQLICSFCSLHALANLRLVSKSFLSRVDGSLTARRTTARPTKVIAPKDAHEADACYVRVSLGQVHDPINVIFDNYNEKYNYLEFVQGSQPALVGSSRLFFLPVASAQGQQASAVPARDLDGNSQGYTLGRLDLNLWEQQQQLQLQQQEHTSSAPPSSTTDQELAVSPGPITPLSQITPAMTASSFAVASATSSSSSTSSSPGALSASSGTQNQGYMARFARMILGDDEGAVSEPPTVDLSEKARQLFHSIDNETLSAKKQYRFGLEDGVHHVGDQDFIMRYTVSFRMEKREEDALATATNSASSPSNQDPQQAPTYLNFADTISQQQPFRLMIHVDYLRVSWKWIICGSNPVKFKARQAGVRLSKSILDPMAQEHPLPHLRIGGIYLDRFNRLLMEIRKQDASRHIRSELAMLGYDASILPRNYLSVNMRSEPVLRWVTGEYDSHPGGAPKHLDQFHQKEEPRNLKTMLEGNVASQKTNQDDEDLVDSDWEDVAAPDSSHLEIKGSLNENGKEKEMEDVTIRDPSEEAENIADQLALEVLVQDLKANLGYLTTRHVLEEILASQGYARELVWKYGIVRREMMGAVPEPSRVDQLLKKIVASEATK
ncbi:hypothetical protein BG004_000581 [Podila humilis]|nr:hypothetical protein BG004_000581 [Podila humilis]